MPADQTTKASPLRAPPEAPADGLPPSPDVGLRSCAGYRNSCGLAATGPADEVMPHHSTTTGRHFYNPDAPETALMPHCGASMRMTVGWLALTIPLAKGTRKPQHPRPKMFNHTPLRVPPVQPCKREDRSLLCYSWVLGLMAASCVSDTRPQLSREELQQRRAGYLERIAGEAELPLGGLLVHVRREQERSLADPTSPPATVDVLILSGGGDRGAFGAGFLKGWGRVHGDLARPEFDAVTGVSTGALLAPFAFVGDEEDYERVYDLYSNPKADWVQGRSVLSFLFTEAPYFDISGLERDIRSVMDLSFVAKVARAAQEGRTLAVGATNLDYNLRRVFVLTSLALAAEKTGDPGPFQDALLASSAIPIVFPPREIEGNLYVDGGLTSNILYSGDPADPNGFSARWIRAFPGVAVPRVRYWVIINSQLLDDPQVVQPRWSALAGPAMTAAIRSATLTSLRELVLLSRLQDAAGLDSSVRWVAIPEDWRPPVAGMFQEATMRDLAALGERVGSDPGCWRTEAPSF